MPSVFFHHSHISIASNFIIQLHHSLFAHRAGARFCTPR